MEPICSAYTMYEVFSGLIQTHLDALAAGVRAFWVGQVNSDTNLHAFTSPACCL